VVEDKISFNRVPKNRQLKLTQYSNISSFAAWFEERPGSRAPIGWIGNGFRAFDTGSSIDQMGAKAIEFLRDSHQTFLSLSDLAVHLMGDYKIDVQESDLPCVGLLILFWTCYDLDGARELFLYGFHREAKSESTKLVKETLPDSSRLLEWKLCDI